MSNTGYKEKILEQYSPGPKDIACKNFGEGLIGQEEFDAILSESDLNEQVTELVVEIIHPGTIRRLNRKYVQEQRRRSDEETVVGRITPRKDRPFYGKKYNEENFRPRHVISITVLERQHSDFEDGVVVPNWSTLMDAPKPDWSSLERVNVDWQRPTLAFVWPTTGYKLL